MNIFSIKIIASNKAGDVETEIVINEVSDDKYTSGVKANLYMANAVICEDFDYSDLQPKTKGVCEKIDGLSSDNKEENQNAWMKLWDEEVPLDAWTFEFIGFIKVEESAKYSFFYKIQLGDVFFYVDGVKQSELLECSDFKEQVFDITLNPGYHNIRILGSITYKSRASENGQYKFIVQYKKDEGDYSEIPFFYSII